MGIRTRRARKRSRTHIVGFGIAGVFGFMILLVVALAFSMGAVIDSWLQDLPDFESADAYVVSEPTQVYDANGDLIAEFYTENRDAVDLDQISQYVIDGTVDTEDVRFYQHNGVDPQGILRAAVTTLMGGSEGASTITQQLVRNTVLSDEQFEKTLKRKVREAYIAIEMEKKYSKAQILNMYLNTIYYGNGAYGIQAASETYFGKDAKDLTLAEAALLVGLPNGPSLYDPFTSPDAALARRNLVLNRMLTAGDITQEQYDEAVAEPLELNPGSSSLDSQGKYPYWSDYIKTLLASDFSTDTINKGGLKIYTTLDPEYQDAAEAAVEKQLDNIGDDELTAALVAIDPSTGYIKAMVGGRDYETSQYNLATQAKRQPGSAFKAFTLAAAIDEGVNPDIYIDCSSPMEITSTWKVQNYNNKNYGTITLERATDVSSNTGYAQVAQAIGGTKIAETAKALGIDVELDPYPSLTLGTIGIPPIQMAEAYSTLAANGVHRDAVAITKIEDRNGNIVYQHKDNPSQVIDSSVAYATTQVLETVVTNGTATQIANNKTYSSPVAGKTGTTENVRDLWFCGYTPQIAVSIWVGYIQEQTIMVHGSDGTPATTACPIFTYFTNSVLADSTYEDFTEEPEPTYKSNSSWDFSAKVSSSSSSSSSTKTETPTVTTTPQEEEKKEDAATSTENESTTEQTPAETPAAGGDGGGGSIESEGTAQ
jgi:1A family penicillin-binding protein